MTDTARVQSAGQYAALGAKAGSIIPVVGTVIGAVVGAVVGWLATKKKPVRATAEQIAQCRSLVNEYMGYATQMPNQPIPMDQEQLRQLNWCIDALYGSKIGLRDPRFFDPDVAGMLIPIARQVVRKIYETPVGATVNLDQISFRVGRQTFKSSGLSFINPAFTDLKTFCDTYFIPMMVQMCKQTAGKGAGGCEAYYGQQPELRRWFYDLLGWAARTELPNISEEDLKAASHVATTVPGSSAKDVVTAVEQIIGRTVQSGETAAILTPATGPPPALPIVPTGSPTNVPPASGVVPSTFVEPLIPLAPTRPAPIQPLPMSTIPEIVSSFAPSNQPVPFAPTKTQAPTESLKNWFENPLVLAGGTLVFGALLFTQKRGGRR